MRDDYQIQIFPLCMGDAMWATRKDSRYIYLLLVFCVIIFLDYFLTVFTWQLYYSSSWAIDRGLHTQKSKNRALARVQHYSLSRRVNLLTTKLESYTVCNYLINRRLLYIIYIKCSLTHIYNHSIVKCTIQPFILNISYQFVKDADVFSQSTFTFRLFSQLLILF